MQGNVIQTSISPDLYARLAESEHCVVRTRTMINGSKTAQVIDAGSLEDMAARAGECCLFIVRPPLESINDCVVPVSELLPPGEQSVGKGAECSVVIEDGEVIQ